MRQAGRECRGSGSLTTHDNCQAADAAGGEEVTQCAVAAVAGDHNTAVRATETSARTVPGSPAGPRRQQGCVPLEAQGGVRPLVRLGRRNSGPCGWRAVPALGATAALAHGPAFRASGRRSCVLIPSRLTRSHLKGSYRQTEPVAGPEHSRLRVPASATSAEPHATWGHTVSRRSGSRHTGGTSCATGTARRVLRGHHPQPGCGLGTLE